MNEQFNLAVFASGSGTNAENIIRYFQSNEQIHVLKILSNNKTAGVHQRATNLGVPSFVFTREEFRHPEFLNQLSSIDYIILAGFLWLVPEYLVKAFPNRILNIHPALLPKFGGKGMYGDNVHKAVIDSGEKESGITIHLVNEKYDEGKVLFQAKCEVSTDDSPETLARKIHALEYTHFPEIIENYILSQHQ